MKPKFKSFFKEVLVLLVLIFIVSLSVNIYKTWDIAAETAPALNETSIQGMPLNLDAAGQPVLVHFWATWCPICSLEQNSIESISADYPVISIAMQSGNEADLKQFMQEQKLDFPVIADESGSLARRWSVKGVPSSFFVSPDGQIRFVEVGYTSELGMRARLWWSGRGTN